MKIPAAHINDVGVRLGLLYEDFRVFGKELQPGDKILATDVYQSQDGDWKSCEMIAGFEAVADGAKIVRKI